MHNFMYLGVVVVGGGGGGGVGGGGGGGCKIHKKILLPKERMDTFTSFLYQLTKSQASFPLSNYREP